MKISDLMYYGRYYRDENEVNHLWWFDLQNNKIYRYDTLLEEYGYESQEDILNSNAFIPMFETDILALEHVFVLKTQNKKVINFFDKISDTVFDKEFKIFVEKNFMTEPWHDFEKKQLYADALKWCKENQIIGITHGDV